MKATGAKRNFTLQPASAIGAPAPLHLVGEPYPAFRAINGQHPWRLAFPGGYIDYPARILRGSKVVYFNFALAKEIGLIPENHAEKLNKDLEKTVIESFALRILNEYDQLHGLQVNARDLKSHPYMATRYLQLQHSSRQGATSGDGRSVWNGCLKGKNNILWDFSSCGTGATRLSPAYAAMKRPIRSGDPEVCYGSGTADVDEGVTAAILSEAFHARGILTERTLCVIESPDGNGINVRAARNLVRPSHLFLPLKQGNHALVKSTLDYHIAREIENGEWPFGRSEVNKYKNFLGWIAERYASFAARLEDEYIFCWMDWDGDNMLTGGGIIDYGSIRQFGLCHHRYRYDDVERFSTNLKEQKAKARNLVQVFAQLVDFVETGVKKELSQFKDDPSLRRFDRCFHNETLRFFCARIGLSRSQFEKVINCRKDLVIDLLRSYRFFERMLDGKGMRRTPDGVNEKAVLDARKLLRELPKRYLERGEPLSCEEFFSLAKSGYTTKKFLKDCRRYQAQVTRFQHLYRRLASSLVESGREQRVWIEWTMRASQRNRTGLVTGDGIIHIVDLLLKKRKTSGKVGFQELIDSFIASQTGRPKKLRGAKLRALAEELRRITEENKYSL